MRKWWRLGVFHSPWCAQGAGARRPTGLCLQQSHQQGLSISCGGDGLQSCQQRDPVPPGVGHRGATLPGSDRSAAGIPAPTGGCPAGVPLGPGYHSSSRSRPLRVAPPKPTEPCSAPAGAEQGRGHAQSGAQGPELSAGARRCGWRWGRALQRASRACLMWLKLISIAV